MINILMEKGACVNYMKNGNIRGHSAIDIAISLKNKSILSILLKSCNLLINQWNDKKETPLTTLLKMKHYSDEEKLQWIEKFTEIGSDVTIGFYQTKNSPLVYAIANENSQIVECLLKHNKTISIKAIIKEMLKWNRTDLISKTTVSNYLNDYKYQIFFNILKNTNQDSNKDLNRKMELNNNEEDMNLSDTNTDTDIDSDDNNEDEDNLSIILNNSSYDDDDDDYDYYKLNIYNVNGEEFDNEYDNDMNNEDLIDETETNNRNYHAKKEIEIIKIINILVDIGININTKDEHGKTLLYYAVENGNINIANHLIKMGADINIIYESKETILDLAINQNPINYTLIMYLIHEGADTNNINYFGINKLIRDDDINLLKWLIQHGLNQDKLCTYEILFFYNRRSIYDSGFDQKIPFLNILNNSGIILSDTKIMKEFSEKCTYSQFRYEFYDDNIMQVNNYLKYAGKSFLIEETPLIDTITNGKNKTFETIKSLINNGANVNEIDCSGYTPLYYAINEITYQKYDIIKYLIDHGAKLIKKNEELEVYDLIEAIKNRNILQIYSHLDSTKNSSFGKEISLVYAIESKCLDIVKILIENGVVPGKNYDSNDNHLNHAIKHSTIEIIKYIIDISSEINNNRPLIVAIENRKYSIVKYLINKGFIIKTCDENCGRDYSGTIFDSPAYHAIFSESSRIFKYLNRHGAPIFERCSDPLLTEAIRYRKFIIMKYLMERGADIHDTNGYQNDKPLNEACYSMNEDLVNYLKNYKRKIKLLL